MEKSRFRVLVVDDYEPWRSFASKTIQKKLELQVVGEASDGLEAVQKAQELRPDLVLLDIGLPRLNGFEAARRILQFVAETRILLLSEQRRPEFAEEALRIGAGGYVVKADAGGDLLPAVTSVLQGKRFVSRSFAGLDFSRTSETGSPREHVVQFYTDEALLVDELAALFRHSLIAGDSVAAIMTSSHRSSLENRLTAQGIDLGEATKSERLVILDADQALSGFMDADGPSREHFLLQFGSMIRRAEAAAVAKTKHVLVFGEMVAVLWAQKKYEEAIRLEQLWNELAQTCSFKLCCAYPASAFSERSGSTYATICALHSDVVSAF